LEFGVWSLEFGVWSLRKIKLTEPIEGSLEFEVWGLEFGVWSLGFGVWPFMYMVDWADRREKVEVTFSGPCPPN